jgi:hypothetical protein
MALTFSKSITQSAMFIALGVLIPLLFHSLGMGSVFLPMFWPVATSGFFLPISYALMVGLLTPVLSTLLTGMPPLSPPILHIMMIELMILAGMISLLKRVTSLGSVPILILSLLCSRAVLFLLLRGLAPLLGLPPALVSVSALIQGLPGVLVMLVAIPFIVHRVKQFKWF